MYSKRLRSDLGETKVQDVVKSVAMGQKTQVGKCG